MEHHLIPLHPAQSDVYTDQLIHPYSPHYNIGGYIRLRGVLNEQQLLETLNSVTGVFDAFRLRFNHGEAAPLCYIENEPENKPAALKDFSMDENPAASALSWMQARFATPLLIHNDPVPFEQCLLKIAANEYWIFGKYHHLIMDGYGFIVFVKYLADKYRSLVTGDMPGFEYPSYTAEMMTGAAYADTPAYQQDAAYWHNKVSEIPRNILQRKYLQPGGVNNASETYELRLTNEQQQSFSAIQSLTGAGIQQLTIAALLIYFGKTSGESSFLFGIPVHKRNSKKLRNIVGMFSGMLAHRGSFNEYQSLADLLKETMLSQKADYRHQHYPLGDLSRQLKATSADGYLYQVSINYEPLNFKLDFGSLAEADILRVPNDNEINPLQLCWRQYGEDQPMQLQIHYGKAFFNKAEIGLLAQRLIYIIEQFPAALNHCIGTIQLLPTAESLLLEKMNDTAVSYPGHSTLVSAFEEQAAKHPGNLAIRFGDTRLTYRQLNELSNQLAHSLISKGVEKDVLVALCIQRSPAMIVAILGILKSGAAYVPIDPGYPEERIRFILDDIGAGILITSVEAMQQPVGLVGECILLDETWSAIKTQPIHNPGIHISKNHLAYVIYTSGSTGRPKGVMVEHGGVVNLINSQSAYFEIGPGENILQFSNYCFDASVEQIFLALLNGAALLLFREGTQLNPDLFGRLLIENKVTHLHATPAFLENLQLQNTGSLRRVIAGGDTCKKELAAYWKSRVQFYNEYGPTETTVTSIEYNDQQGLDVLTPTLPIGKPIANTRLYILGKGQERLPVGVAGELFIAGAGVARGYLQRPDLTTERFIADIFSNEPGAKMYRTGDLARWLPDGNLEYLGRIDEQVKIRGFRIELGEIENVLQEHEGVRQAVVAAREDAQGDKRLVAYIVPAAAFDRNALQEYLKKRLPDYMVPAVWVPMDEIPLTANGKVNKKNLPDPIAGPGSGSEYEAPVGEMEILLVATWQDILKLGLVGVNDHFFELGGHSLNAIQLSSRIHKLLNIKVDIGFIFSHPTIRQMATALLLQTQQLYADIPRQPVQEYYPLSHAQKRFWILSHFKDGSEAYNVSNAFVIEGNFSLDAFVQAFKLVMERHEILRTVFMERDGEAMQKILTVKDAPFSMETFDLLKETDPDSLVKQWLDDDARKPFDLTSGPLMRNSVFRTGNNRWILVVNMHHIISDGWSKGILIREVLTCYQAVVSGRAHGLPPLPVQYKDYAAWHANLFEKQGQYWRNLFVDGVPVLNFPSDFKRPPVLTFFGAMLHIRVAESLTCGLQKRAVEYNMSLNNLLFALYGLLVSRYSKQEEIVIGSLTSGRSHIDLENLVGVFINFLPIKLKAGSKLSLDSYLGETNQVLVQAYNNQDYPFDLMVGECIRQRDASRNPFFDTMVNFHLANDTIAKGGDANLFSHEGGVSIVPYQAIQGDLFQSVLDFKLDIEPAGEALDFYLSYNSNLFLENTMQSFLDDFVDLLSDVVSEPGKQLTDYGPPGSVSQSNNSIQTGTPAISLPVNICASFVVEPVQEFIEYWSNEFDLNAKVSFAPYNQVFQQLIDPKSLLNSGKGINVLFVRVDDWLKDQQGNLEPEQLHLLDRNFADIQHALLQFSRQSFIPLLIGVVPQDETSNPSPPIRARITQINAELEALIKKQAHFQLVDFDAIARLYDVPEVFDPHSDQLGHMPFTQEFYAALGTFIARKVHAFRGTGYKVIALDCDNTLWKGICGEVGALGVIIDEHFNQLQEFMLEKHREGFLLTLCSKNNEADVWEVFDRHPGMKLKREHIAAYQVNWAPKPGNLAALAKELNLSLNSIIFLDDSEFEIEQVSVGCPDVLAVPLPEHSADFKSFLDHIWAFDYFKVTDEDAKRNELYRLGKQRNAEQVNFGSLDEFLQSLEIQVDIRDLAEHHLDRAVQLSLRTNQFNLNGVRKTPSDIAALINQTGRVNWIIGVKDRFGDYGIVGLVLAGKVQQVLVLDTFLLSCRVLGRNVEDRLLAKLLQYCNENELVAIHANFQATEKNKPCLEFLIRTGWLPDPLTGAYHLSAKHIKQQIVAGN